MEQHIETTGPAAAPPSGLDTVRGPAATSAGEEELRRLARTLEERQSADKLKENPFYGAGIANLSDEQKRLFGVSLGFAAEQIRHFQSLSREIAAALDLPPRRKDGYLISTLSALEIIDRLYTKNGDYLRGVSLSDSRWSAGGREIERAIENHSLYAELREKLGTKINFEALKDIDFVSADELVKEHEQKGMLGRAFNFRYQAFVKVMSAVISVPEDPAEFRQELTKLNQIQTLRRAVVRSGKELAALVPHNDFNPGSPLTDRALWIRYAQFAHALIDFVSVTADHPDRQRLETLLRNPAHVYEQSEKIRELEQLEETIEKSYSSIASALQFAVEDSGSPDEAQAARFGRLRSWQENLSALDEIAAANRAAAMKTQ